MCSNDSFDLVKVTFENYNLQANTLFIKPTFVIFFKYVITKCHGFF